MAKKKENNMWPYMPFPYTMPGSGPAENRNPIREVKAFMKFMDELEKAKKEKDKDKDKKKDDKPMIGKMELMTLLTVFSPFIGITYCLVFLWGMHSIVNSMQSIVHAVH